MSSVVVGAVSVACRFGRPSAGSVVQIFRFLSVNHHRGGTGRCCVVWVVLDMPVLRSLVSDKQPVTKRRGYVIVVWKQQRRGSRKYR